MRANQSAWAVEIKSSFLFDPLFYFWFVYTIGLASSFLPVSSITSFSNSVDGCNLGTLKLVPPVPLARSFDRNDPAVWARALLFKSSAEQIGTQEEEEENDEGKKEKARDNVQMEPIQSRQEMSIGRFLFACTRPDSTANLAAISGSTLASFYCFFSLFFFLYSYLFFLFVSFFFFHLSVLRGVTLC